MAVPGTEIEPVGAKRDAPGTYVLLLCLDRDCEIAVGALGRLFFRRGFYLYVGSALGGLRRRLARHVGMHKRLHWHIDYLLGFATVGEIWYREGTERRECGWAQALSGLPGVEPFGAAFGASDCSCATHLFYTRLPPHAARFQSVLGDRVRVERVEVGGRLSLDGGGGWEDERE